MLHNEQSILTGICGGMLPQTFDATVMLVGMAMESHRPEDWICQT